MFDKELSWKSNVLRVMIKEQKVIWQLCKRNSYNEKMSYQGLWYRTKKSFDKNKMMELVMME